MESNRYRELSVNTALFAVSSLGSRLVQFLLLPLYTAALSTADYGTVDLVLSLVALLVPVLTLNIQDAVLRFGLDEDADSDEVLSVGMRSVVIGALILAVILLIAFAMKFEMLDGVYSAFAFAMYLFGAFGNVLTMHLKSQNQVKPIVVSGIGSTLVTCVFAILLLVVFPMSVLGYMLALAAGGLFSVCYLAVADKITIGSITRLRPGLFKIMIAYSLPLVANGLAWWVSDLSDRYVVAIICGVAANGIYAVAYKIPAILVGLQTIFYNAWSISAIKEFDAEDPDGFLGEMYGLYSCCMCLCCSVILILNLPLAQLLFANEFLEAWRYVPPLLVGAYLNGLALFEGCIFAAAKRTKEVAVSTIAGAAIGVVLCVALTALMGVMGAAIATFCGYLAIWAIRTGMMHQKVARIKTSWMAEIVSLVVLCGQAALATQENMLFLQIPVALLLVVAQRKRLIRLVEFASQRFNKSDD